VIRDLVSAAWAQSPAQVIAAVALAPVAVVLAWITIVVVIVSGGPA
jgi:hypothetical protein